MTQAEPADLERLLFYVAFTIWDSMLGVQADRVAARDVSWGGVRDASAWVGFTGGFEGTLILRCAWPLAERFTRHLFGEALASPSSADTLDALAELANIAAGNLKSYLPGPSTLGVPRAGLGSYDPPVMTVPLSQVGFLCEGSPGALSLLRATRAHS